MDSLKRNILWLVLAAILLVFIGFYVIKVRPVWAKAGQLRTEVDNFSKTFGPYVNRKKNIPSQDKIVKLQRYKKELVAALDEVKDTHLSRQFSLAKAKFTPPPPDNPVDFRNWLQEQYEVRDEIASKANPELKIVTVSPAQRGDYDVENVSVPVEEHDIAKKRLYITREIYRALTKCSVTVKVKV